MKRDPHQLMKTGFPEDGKVIRLAGDALKKLQNVELDMLKDVIEVADRNSVNYSLSGGSVLGAVRHKGFIPWDDDIDINMPRKDFDRFKRIFEKELSEKYELCAPELGQDYGMAMSQIKKRGTVYRSFNELSQKESGICIDIFVMENVPDNRVARTIHGVFSLAFGYMLSCRKTYEDISCLKEYFKENRELKKVFMKKARIGRLFFFLSLNQASWLTWRCYSWCRNEESEYITIPSGRKHYFGEIGKRAEMCRMKKVPFETIMVNIPKGAERYMERLYGTDYMELPPEEKRERHPIMELDFGEEDSNGLS